MDQWNYNILVVDITGGFNVNPSAISISKMWEVRGPDGLTNWDRLQQMGREGWDLVNCFPMTGSGSTTQVIWVFKRRAQAQQAQPMAGNQSPQM
jgi:hypothetical protein